MVRGGGRGAPLPPLGPCFSAGTAPSRVLRPRVGQCACPGRGAGLERGAGAEDGVAESAGPPASPAGGNRGSSGGGGGGGGSGSGGGDGSRSAARRGDGTAAQPGKRRACTCCPLQAGGVDRLLRLAAAPEPLSRVLEPPGWRGLGTVRSVCLACARGECTRAAGATGVHFQVPLRGGAGVGPQSWPSTRGALRASPPCKTPAPLLASPLTAALFGAVVREGTLPATAGRGPPALIHFPLGASSALEWLYWHHGAHSLSHAQCGLHAGAPSHTLSHTHRSRPQVYTHCVP